MDADDILEGELKFPPKLTADQYYIKLRTDFNNYYRPLLIKNDKKYNWEFKDGLHEFLSSDYPNILTYTLIGDYAINSRRISDRNKNTQKAHDDIAFLEILMQERPDYPRYKHYYAQSFYDAKLYKEAIQAYTDYIPHETFEEAKYLARIMIGRAHLRLDSPEPEIIKAFTTCFKYYPEYAEPMFELCKYFNAKKDYETAYLYGNQVVNHKLPISKLLAIDTEVYTFKLLDEIIWCCVETKRYDEALKYSHKLTKSDKINKEQKQITLENIKIITNLKNQSDVNNHSIIEHLLSKLTKPILGIYLGPSPLETYYGSELAVMNLVEQFKDDYHVLIFADNTTQINLTQKEPIYLPSSILKNLLSKQFHIMIVSRYINYFIEVDANKIAKKTFFWLHDINFHPYYNGTHLPNNATALVKNTEHLITGYICSSQWHKEYILEKYKLPQDKVHVIGLGIDTDMCLRLLNITEKVKNRFIWVSDYNRNLEDFVKKFAIIKAYLVDAELHIYRDLPEELKKKWQYLDYIKLKGHQDNKIILQAMASAEYFCLISDFEETFCLSALEAQAMKCICITTDLAALKSTIGDRGLVVTKHTLLDELASLLEDDARKTNLQNKAHKWAMQQSWNKISKQWISLFKRNTSNMFKRLLALKDIGFDPKFILDIGAHIGEWSRSIKNLYPNTHIQAFEANPDCKPYLSNINHEIVLLGDQETDSVMFYTLPNKYCTTGSSILREQTIYYNDPKILYLPMKTLDSYVTQSVDLMKLDVQGSELLVLEGAKNTLKKTEFVLLEVSIMIYNEKAPLVAEVINYMKNKGFNVFDIFDNHYIDDYCVQTDILFLNTNSKFTIKKTNTHWQVNNIYS
jgi:FkbM family methyltransferase